MVANIRCEELQLEQLEAFRRDPAWVALEAEAGADLATSFGQRAADLMDSCLEGERMSECCGLGLVSWRWQTPAGATAACRCQPLHTASHPTPRFHASIVHPTPPNRLRRRGALL